MSAGPVKAKPAKKTAKPAPTAKRPVAKPAAKPANPTRITATNADEILKASIAKSVATLANSIAQITEIENDVHTLRAELRATLAAVDKAQRAERRGNDVSPIFGQ